MTTHEIGTREQWLKARLELLEAEKELTCRNDELARHRRQLPWVRIDKEYVFDTGEGEQALRDLFAGRSQLLVYHFMFGPDIHGGVSVLLADRGKVRRVHHPSGNPRRDADSRVARAAARSFRRTSGGWAGLSLGRPPSAATSTTTSPSRSPRSNSERGSPNTTTGPSRGLQWCRQFAAARGSSRSSRP